MALMMPDRHYVSHGRYWGGGTNRMPLCYRSTSSTSSMKVILHMYYKLSLINIYENF